MGRSDKLAARFRVVSCPLVHGDESALFCNVPGVLCARAGLDPSGVHVLRHPGRDDRVRAGRRLASDTGHARALGTGDHDEPLRGRRTPLIARGHRPDRGRVWPRPVSKSADAFAHANPQPVVLSPPPAHQRPVAVVQVKGPLDLRRARGPRSSPQPSTPIVSVGSCTDPPQTPHPRRRRRGFGGSRAQPTVNPPVASRQKSRSCASQSTVAE